jgi:SAM-dependent methyltransferase
MLLRGSVRHGTATAGDEYRPFPEKADRNARQQSLEVPLLVRCLGLRHRARLLEVGCGAGVALPVFRRLCAPELLVGLDIDGVALEHAARRTALLHPSVQLIRADARSIPVCDEFFDAVVDFGTCYHIARSGDAVSEIERVLRTGGVFATETKLNQFLSHPVRSRGRALHLHAAPALRLEKHCGLWISFEKVPHPGPR